MILERDTKSKDYPKLAPLTKQVIYYFSMSNAAICKHKELTLP